MHEDEEDHVLPLGPHLVEAIGDIVHLLPVVASALIVELDDRKLKRLRAFEAAAPWCALFGRTPIVEWVSIGASPATGSIGCASVTPTRSEC